MKKRARSSRSAPAARAVDAAGERRALEALCRAADELGIHAVDAPYTLVAHLTFPSGRIETLSAHFHERSDALTVARMLRRGGWEVTVRVWREDQRITGHDASGRPIFGAGYVAVQE